MEGYIVEIAEVSRELTAKERVAMKDTSNAVSLDNAVDSSPSNKVVIKPVDYAVLAIHIDNAKEGENKDYTNYIIVAEDGTKYVTGSGAFYSSFRNIYDEMKNESEEWALECYKKPSKNFTGKGFITCSII